MTKEEALNLVLHDINSNIAAVRSSTITAIKEALAPTSTQCEVQPEQEPVALQMDVIVVNLVREGIAKATGEQK